jgi:ferredoxin
MGNDLCVNHEHMNSGCVFFICMCAQRKTVMFGYLRVWVLANAAFENETVGVQRWGGSHRIHSATNIELADESERNYSARGSRSKSRRIRTRAPASATMRARGRAAKMESDYLECMHFTTSTLGCRACVEACGAGICPHKVTLQNPGMDFDKAFELIVRRPATIHRHP